MDNFNLQSQLKGKRQQLLALGFSRATVSRLLYKPGWLPKSGTLLKLRTVADIPFALSGRELAARMQRLNVSIAEMHRRSGVSRGMISGYMRDKTQLRMDTLKQLVDALPTRVQPSKLKLSKDDIATILASHEPVAVLAQRYDIDPSYVSHLRARAKR